MTSALITGVTGQDGSYLAELLLEKGYEVHGMHRRISVDGHERIEHLKKDINLIYGDLLDPHSIELAIKESKPDEVYNLAAMSQVGVSFKMPYLTREVNYHGVARILYALKKLQPKARFYQASTSEMFGNAKVSPQNENTPFMPVSPYGEAKRDAHVDLVGELFRKKHKMFAVGGILFNHESPRRGMDFVTRKISYHVAKMKLGMENVLELGNIDAKRDWGFAGDYVRAMWMMLQQDEPEDFLLATGKTHSVREFLDFTFKHAGMKYELVDLSKKPVKEADAHIKKELKKGGPYVVIHPRFFRPADIHILVGDSSKAKKKLGWKPNTGFEGLVKLMLDADMELLSK
ncbi:GDP-mannose 4,6-dehydratase [Nanoarchaeota archaeon]